MQKANRVVKALKNPNSVFIAVLAVGILSSTAGYCNDDVMKELNAKSDTISNFLFGGTVRKVALTLGMGAGLFQAFMSGSIRPLLIYGGLGLAVAYLPAMVNWISSIG